MEKMIQKIEEFRDKIAEHKMNVQAQQYTLVLVCGSIVPQLKEQIYYELRSKFRNEKFFEVQQVQKETPEQASDLVLNMLNNFLKKLHEKEIYLSSVQINMVFAENNYAVEKIKKIYNSIHKAMTSIEINPIYIIQDYFIIDLKKQKFEENKNKVSEQWLQQIEDFYKEQSHVPYIFTEDRFTWEDDNPYQAAIQAIAELIMISMIKPDFLKERLEDEAWRTVAYWKQDLLRYYIVEFFENVAEKRKTAETLALTGNAYIEKIDQFLKEQGVFFPKQEAVRVLKNMPVCIDEYVNPATSGPFSFLHKKKLGAQKALELFENLCGKKYFREFIDLNYGDINESGKIETLIGKIFKEPSENGSKLFLGKFWDADLGTFSDVQHYLRNNLEGQLTLLQKKREQYKKVDGQMQQIRIDLGKATSNTKKFIEELQDNINTGNILMEVLNEEELERQITVYEAILDILNSQPFKDMLQFIQEEWERTIHLLDVLKNEYFHSTGNIVLVHLPGKEIFLKNILMEPGSWKQTEFGEGLLEQMQEYLLSEEMKKIIIDWLQNNQGVILSSFYDYINLLERNAAGRDPAAFRNDYLSKLVPIQSGNRMIYYGLRDLKAVMESAKIVLGEVDACKVDWLDEFTLEYFQMYSYRSIQSILKVSKKKPEECKR